jgi:uncharacterized membrane protein (GlpM family)
MTAIQGSEEHARGAEPPAAEPALHDRQKERPRLDLRQALQAKPRDLLIRFVAGAVTSICAGAVTLLFGPRVGGILLAFPAILGASLTLIEEQEDSADAREDARGAIVGACAMAVFAVVVALTVGHVDGAVALVIGAAAWLVSAVGLYVLLWWR